MKTTMLTKGPEDGLAQRIKATSGKQLELLAP